MRNGIEFVDYLESQLAEISMSPFMMSKLIGISRATMIGWKKFNRLPTVEVLFKISELLKIPVNELVDEAEVKKVTYPADIRKMIDMLTEIPEENRKMISMNIKNYYDVEQEKKKKNSSTAG